MTGLAPVTLERCLMRALKTSGSSFYWGIRLLPRHRRCDLAVVYLFCRLMDDIADGPLSDAEKESLLAAWKDVLGSLRDLPPQRPLVVPDTAGLPLAPLLRQVVDRHALNPTVLQEIVEGVRMDLHGGLQAPDEETFALYCHRIAGCVGVATVRVLGCQGKTVDRFAQVTGDALQITNILRDVHDDARAGRLYLPASVLVHHGITLPSAQAILHDPAIEAVCQNLAARAQRHYARALRLYRSLTPVDRRCLRPALVMLSSYRLVLRKLRARGWKPQVLARPCHPSRWRLLGDALQTWVLGR